ncbi:fructose bisphosphate aldolase [Rhodovibrionaceae bacterium A322]
MTGTASNQEQWKKVSEGKGFIAALDQSGGSTPKALGLYGIEPSAWSNDEEMFDLMHQMRVRIMTSRAFQKDQIVGAILFEKTMDSQAEGQPVPAFLWEKCGVVPFLKVDKGLEAEADGVSLMKPMPGLGETLDRAAKLGIFGTKMRSVIKSASESGINAIVDQQFEVGKEILSHGLVPIIEPEVDINSADKGDCEKILFAAILKHLDALSDDQSVMLKLTLPNDANAYKALIDHPRVLRVVALSGGYSTDVACEKLSQNDGMIASFSRALTEGLNVSMSDDEFEGALEGKVEKIYQASL